MKTASSILFLAVLAHLGQPLPLRAADTAADDRAIDHAIASFTLRVQDLARTQPGAFGAILRQALGSQLTAKAEHDLIEAAVRGALPRPALFRFIEPEVLAGAAGTYSPADGGTVLLNSDCRDDSALLLEIVTHEWGHHLDAVLGSADARGEEGEIFQQGVSLGGPIPDPTYRRLATIENRAVIVLDNRSLSVEKFLGFLNPNSLVKRPFVKALGVLATVPYKNKEDGGKLLGKFVREEPKFVKDVETVADEVTVMGREYNKAIEALDKVSPGLGTALNVGVTAIPIAGQIWAGYTTSSKIYEQAKAGDGKGAINTAIFEGGAGILGTLAGGVPVGKVFGSAGKGFSKLFTKLGAKFAPKAASGAATQAEAAMAAHLAEVAAREAAEEATKAAAKKAAAVLAAKKAATAGTTALRTTVAETAETAFWTGETAFWTAGRTRAGAVLTKPGLVKSLTGWLASNPTKGWFVTTGLKAGFKGGIVAAPSGVAAVKDDLKKFNNWAGQKFGNWVVGGSPGANLFPKPTLTLTIAAPDPAGSQTSSQLQGLQLTPGGTQFNTFVTPPAPAPEGGGGGGGGCGCGG